MVIIPIESGPVYTIGYLVYDNESKDCVVVDLPYESAGWFVSNINSLNLNLRAVFLTHSHWDHTIDTPELISKIRADIYIHKDDEYRILAPNDHTVWKIPFDMKPIKADKYFEDDAIISLGTLSFKILHTPGHTEGSVCILNEEEKIVFTGDTLFSQSIGRSDLPGGNSDKLMNSIFRKLMTLSGDFQVFSGHGESTNIDTERRYNPFLREIGNLGMAKQ